MDKTDLDFLVDSQDANLLYKHILEAICNNSTKVRDIANRYTINQMIIYSLSTCILYRSKRNVDIGRVNRYVMELQ